MSSGEELITVSLIFGGLWLYRRLNQLELMLHMLALPAPPVSERDKSSLTLGREADEARREIRREELRRNRLSLAQFVANLRSVAQHQLDMASQGDGLAAMGHDETRQEIARLEREARVSLPVRRV